MLSVIVIIPHLRVCNYTIIFQNGETLYKNTMNKAIDYVAKALSPNLDAYSLTLVWCALANARHPQASQVLQYLDKYSNTTGKIEAYKHKTRVKDNRH